MIKLFSILLLLICSEVFPLRVHAIPSFFEQASREVEKSLRGRDGAVIFSDRLQKKQILFGNTSLLHEKFLPGSLMKLITAEAALLSGKMPTYHCSGHDRIGGKKMFCWTPQGHGEVDLAKAISVSCNLYFAKLANQIGSQALLDRFANYSFSDWKQISERNFPPEKTASLAIGDNPLFRVTPLEMAAFWDLFLTRLQDPTYAVIEQGLRRSVQEGTGKRAISTSFEILGKTGTADSQNSNYKTDGWFLGAYPVRNPRYAVVVFLKRSHGYQEAATLAGKIFSLGYQLGVFQEGS